MHFFRTDPLIQKLAAEKLSMQDKASYLLAGSVLYIAFYYSGLAPYAFPLWSTPSILEGLAVICIGILGVVRAFDAGGGETNRYFIDEFICLTVPIWFTTTLSVWVTFRIVIFFFGEALQIMSRSNMQFVKNASALGFDLPALLLFCATVGSQVIFFARMVKALRAVRHAKVNS